MTDAHLKRHWRLHDFQNQLCKKTMNNAITFKTFGNSLIFNRKELGEWVETNTITKPTM
jgi:hypothetical protein